MLGEDFPYDNVQGRIVHVIAEVQLGDNDVSEENRKELGLLKTDHPRLYSRFPAIQAFSNAEFCNKLCKFLSVVL